MNVVFVEFYEQHNIAHEFSAHRTPQENDVVEGKNRILEEVTHVMPNAKDVPKKFRAEALNTACYKLTMFI